MLAANWSAPPAAAIAFAPATAVPEVTTPGVSRFKKAGDAVMAANRFANIVDELSDDPDDDSYSE